MRAVVLAAACLMSWSGLHAQSPDLEGQGFDKGHPSAPLSVVEFADFGCSACTQFALETFPVIDERLIESGQVRWTFVPFDLGAFKHSKQATMAAICAAEQEGFWLLHDVLFANGGEVKHSRDIGETLTVFAARIGLDVTAFAMCYESEDTEERANNLRKLARKHGVRGTPTFLIGGQKLAGALPTEEFLELLRESLRH